MVTVFQSMVVVVIAVRYHSSIVPFLETSNETWNIDAYDCRKGLDGAPGDKVELR